MEELRSAAAAGESMRFRQQSHALGSGASNIGARGLSELCRTGQQMRTAEIAARGPSHIRRLEAEFERVRQALAPYRTGQTARPGEAGGGKPR
ncbi:Hpt domain-containing protein [Caldovatus aquaticus]|nr:Hpt domain-containing protein [Caldovatus aquaticus]